MSEQNEQPETRTLGAEASVAAPSAQAAHPLCAVPECASRPFDARTKLCFKHHEMLTFLFWALPRIQVQRAPTAKSLYVPGAPAVKR